MAQKVDGLSAGDTAIRFLPMGAIGFIVSLGTGKLLEYMNAKYCLIAGLVLSVMAAVPSAMTATVTENLYEPSPMMNYAKPYLLTLAGSTLSAHHSLVYPLCPLSSLRRAQLF